MTDRQCTKCGETKAIELFPLRTTRGNNRVRRPQCAECFLGAIRDRRASGSYVECKASQKERNARKFAKEKAAGYPHRNWHTRLKGKVAQAAKEGREYWPDGCRVDIPKHAKKRVYSKPWHGKGIDRLTRHRLRWEFDPKYRLYHRMKRWMQKHLRDGRKSVKWSAVIGYQPDELATHLERQFTKGMGWHNMGEWHIDHIVPVAAFKFTSAHDQDFVACYALSNLRPIWAAENLRKHAARTHLI